VSKQLLTVTRIQQYVQQQQVASIVNLPGIQAQVIEFEPGEGSKVTKKPLKKVRFPVNAIVGAILQNNQLVIPKGDTRVQPGDKVVVFSLPEAVDEVEKFFL